VLLFDPFVSSIIGEEIIPDEQDQFSNVIKDNRARLGAMREKKTLPTTSSFDA
jgi:hypothetical protein